MWPRAHPYPHRPATCPPHVPGVSARSAACSRPAERGHRPATGPPGGGCSTTGQPKPLPVDSGGSNSSVWREREIVPFVSITEKGQQVLMCNAPSYMTWNPSTLHTPLDTLAREVLLLPPTSSVPPPQPLSAYSSARPPGRRFWRGVRRPGGNRAAAGTWRSRAHPPHTCSKRSRGVRFLVDRDRSAPGGRA